MASPGSVAVAAVGAVLVAAAAGIALALLTSAWLLVVGAAAVLALVLYSGGPAPYGKSAYGWEKVTSTVRLSVAATFLTGAQKPALTPDFGSLNSRIAAPCFLIAARHIILPAFSTDAAGVNVFRNPQWRSYRCCAIAGNEVLDFGKVAALQKVWSAW